MDELAVLDREAFAQVWGRVDPDGAGPVEVVGQAPGAGEKSAGLRELVLECLAGAAGYRALGRRTRRAPAVLGELERRKVAQARRLAAAYFLLSGVRYWPREATPVDPPEGFFPAMRWRYLAEGRLARRLHALADRTDDADLAQLYHALAGETEEMARVLRRTVEREM